MDDRVAVIGRREVLLGDDHVDRLGFGEGGRDAVLLQMSGTRETLSSESSQLIGGRQGTLAHSPSRLTSRLRSLRQLMALHAGAEQRQGDERRRGDRRRPIDAH